MHPPFLQAGISPVIVLVSQGQEDEEQYELLSVLRKVG